MSLIIATISPIIVIDNKYYMTNIFRDKNTSRNYDFRGFTK
jgi:hypothetical protein